MSSKAHLIGTKWFAFIVNGIIYRVIDISAQSYVTDNIVLVLITENTKLDAGFTTSGKRGVGYESGFTSHVIRP